jgi:hypothetical protein
MKPTGTQHIPHRLEKLRTYNKDLKRKKKKKEKKKKFTEFEKVCGFSKVFDSNVFPIVSHERSDARSVDGIQWRQLMILSKGFDKHFDGHSQRSHSA